MWANNIKPYSVGLFLGYLNVPPVSCRHLEELIARSGVVSRERERERERERRRTGFSESLWRALLFGYSVNFW